MTTSGPLGIGEHDLYLFNEGTHRQLGEVLGAQVLGADGVRFVVWAPNARAISVVGDFNGWNQLADPLERCGASGLWQCVVPSACPGQVYKYAVEGHDGSIALKADPVALFAEHPPKTGSVIWDLGFEWTDHEWMARRGATAATDAPISIYEVHLGSWWRDPGESWRLPTYEEVSDRLIEHMQALGYTHVELLPIMEHPFYPSWGYQCSSYFAPTSRYGTPQQLMAMIDALHAAGIGVILDWVPSHFVADEWALARFDGTHLYEHADPRMGVHPDWKSLLFNYGRHEVRSFLVSSAMHWIERYHVDGIRVDAVSSMLFRDYSRAEGEWIPNTHGGRENLEAIGFLRQLTGAISEEHPAVALFAEESTGWPGVTRSPSDGGLGFRFMWDMGWMHDTLGYLEREPIHRRFHHRDITFRSLYACNEHFVLPLSHDEVVHLKGSLLTKMPGDRWQQMANVRLALALQTSQPGKSLCFMGDEFGAETEWNHDVGLSWGLLDDPMHAGLQRLAGDLNHWYRSTPALYELDSDPTGFEWVLADEAALSIYAYLRRGRDGSVVVCVINATPVPRADLMVEVPVGGVWREALNTDSSHYGGSGVGNLGEVRAERGDDGRERIRIVAPPLASVFFTRGGEQ